MEALEAARSELRTSVDGARQRLKHAIHTHEHEVARARKDLEAASNPRRLASLGVAKKVTITETSITTPRGTFPLTEGISAQAEQQGMKQVVQGWVVKSNQDRREVYLHINGPGWADVVTYNIQYATVRPQDIYQFALNINGASANAATHRAAVIRRTMLAEQALANQLDASRQVSEDAASLAVVAAQSRDAEQRKSGLRGLLDNADIHQDRHTRKALGLIEDTDRDVERWRSEAESQVSQASERFERATKEAAELRASAEEKQGLLPEGREVAQYLTSASHVFEPLGWHETRRMTGSQLGGVPVIGDIEMVDDRNNRLWVTILSDASSAEMCKQNLLGTRDFARAVRSGITRMATSDAILLVAKGQGIGRMADETFDELLRAIEAVPIPELHENPVGAEPMPPAETAGQVEGKDDVLDAISKLAALHEAGVLTDEEFNNKKAELLARI